MTIQLTSGVSNDTSLLSPGLPINGGDSVGGNLILRSTSNVTKGAVILDETTQSYSPNSGALQVFGGVGALHNFSSGGAYIHNPLGLSLGNIIVNPGQGGHYPQIEYVMGTMNLSGTGSRATISYSGQNTTPFVISASQNITTFSVSGGFATVGFSGGWGVNGNSVPVTGQQITISGAFPAAYNGTYTVLAATSTSVTIQCSATGTITANGTISSVGEWVTITGCVPTAYNGTYQPINCTATDIIIPSSATGSLITAGIIANHNLYGSYLPQPTNPAVSSAIFPTYLPTINVTTPQLAGGVQAQAVSSAMNYIVVVTACTGNGSTATLTFNAQPAPPFPLGSLINVRNVNPGGYNGIYTVTACTTTTVSYLNGITTALGTANSGIIHGASIISTSITNPGTGYFLSPRITFQDPSPTPVTIDYVATGVAVGQFVSINSYIRVLNTSNGVTNVYRVIRAGSTGIDYLAGNSAPTFTSADFGSGNCTLRYVGTIASGISSLGYSGLIAQGATHQVGSVVNCVLQVAGTGYTLSPTLTFTAPETPGGRTAQAVCTISGGSIQFINVTDPGSGYLTPPRVFISASNGIGSGGMATAVIGHPGDKPIVSTMPVSNDNTYTLDFGMSGHNTVFLTTSSSSTFYFDNRNNTGNQPYTKGFPIGRKITLYVKATGGITLTFANLVAANSSTGANNPSLTSGRVGRYEFVVLSTSNAYNQAGGSAIGGTNVDVYATIIST